VDEMPATPTRLFHPSLPRRDRNPEELMPMLINEWQA
jgi:hypothetical protein